VGTAIPLARLEEIIDASGVAPAIEAILPAGVRQRQLHPRTLLAGIQLALTDRRPAHLTEAHAALTSLPRADQERLGVTADWHGGPHRLTYRQAGHTHRIINRALAKDQPDGAPSPRLQHVCDQLTEASIPEAFKNTSTSMAADWTDVEAWARPVPHEAAGTGTGPEASWGHRNVGRSVQEGEMFFGYYLSAAVMVADENGEPVPELARRITVASPGHDPAAELAGVLTTMPASGIAPGDIIADSGYAHRVPDTWANPLRAAGADLVQDLHPHDRGPRGTHNGAIIANGNPYCPATPGPLPDLVPLPPGAPAAAAAAQARRQPSSPATSSASTPPRTPTATAGMPAPPPPGRSAARCAPNRSNSTAAGPRSSPRPSTRQPAALSRPSPPAPASRPKPGRSMTTHHKPGGPPTGGAPPPSGSTPRSRTPPSTASTPAGSG
jgi:hypothetical protein